ncbi:MULTISPECIES: LysR family transcriptional regulator [Bradyrhizobium]|uniref:LysR family transcriptional regulator n=1 Tax=Bradyrhizobium australafricanum TaxID=2821406 RepID=UPI001CE30D4F|nr:LysR family transcriptional regulator [Bradyrhizobium australafricanum]MCA6104121.1 LysR family transcriptional regulator [Bradyrhizobium australafricanum]
MRDNRLLEMQIFRAVVEHNGFTAAAYALESSQPFVSRAIAQLERRLGAKLIHRTTRQHRLTAEGERYLATCREILAALDDAENAFAGQSTPAGDLRVSAPLAFGTDQVLPLLPGFLATHDRVRVHLSLSDTIVSLIDDNFDVAVRMGRLRDSQLRARKLCDLRRIVVAAPDYVRRRGAPPTPAALKDHNCLEWHGAQEHLNRWPFSIEGERRDHIAAGNFRSSNGLSLAEMCFQGVGVMRMAEHLALPAIRDGRLLRLLPEFEEHDGTAIHAVYLPERRLSARVRVFIDYLADALRSPPWSQAD